MKIECPQCHSLFRVVTEDKKLIEDEKAEGFAESAGEKVEDALEGLIPMSRRVPGSLGEDVDVEDLTYEYRFKCKRCGHEWTELEEKERRAQS